jgi:hypothetical protein
VAPEMACFTKGKMKTEAEEKECRGKWMKRKRKEESRGKGRGGRSRCSKHYRVALYLGTLPIQEHEYSIRRLLG